MPDDGPLESPDETSVERPGEKPFEGFAEGAGALRLSDALRGELQELARAAYPDEACGLLVGRTGPEGARVLRVEPARNRAEDRLRDRYELDPLDLLRIEDEARAQGLEVVGVWHSHPDHRARPSATDRDGAWEGWSYLIVAVGADGASEMRAWRLREHVFVEERIRP